MDTILRQAPLHAAHLAASHMLLNCRASPLEAVPATRRGSGQRGNTETDSRNWHLKTMTCTESIRFARDRHALV